MRQKNHGTKMIGNGSHMKLVGCMQCNFNAPATCEERFDFADFTPKQV